MLGCGCYRQISVYGAIGHPDQGGQSQGGRRPGSGTCAGSGAARFCEGQRWAAAARFAGKGDLPEPDIIVLDEPTSFLDIRHKLELLSILRSMAKENRITVIMSLHEIDLAKKISDKIMCVKGETIGQYGTPEEVFREANIRSLYEIKQGFFDPVFGSIELSKPEGEAKVLVISACGTGIGLSSIAERERPVLRRHPVYERYRLPGRTTAGGGSDRRKAILRHQRRRV